jgi:hypothetical protein
MYNLIHINIFGIILKIHFHKIFLVMLEVWLNLKMEEGLFLIYLLKIDIKWIRF